MDSLSLDILKSLSSTEGARRLLGCELERDMDGETLRVRIVETEGYDQDDEASHAYGGVTKRNRVMFGPSGRLYVYFTYGMHYCSNIVVGGEGYGSGVLIRAVEPIEGLETMSRNRGYISGRNMTNGPAKLTKAIGIDFGLLGHDLNESPLRLIIKPKIPDNKIIRSKRIGISKAKDELRRFYIKDSKYTSKR